MTAHQQWLGITSPTADINSDAPHMKWVRPSLQPRRGEIFASTSPSSTALCSTVGQMKRMGIFGTRHSCQHFSDRFSHQGVCAVGGPMVAQYRAHR